MSDVIQLVYCDEDLVACSPGGEPLPRRAAQALSDILRYNRKTFLTPYQRRLQGISQAYSFETVLLYETDGNFMMFRAGYLQRAKQALLDAGYSVVGPVGRCVDEETSARMEPDFETPFQRYSPRDWQIDALAVVHDNDRGLIEAPTGDGKGTLIKLIRLMYPQARMHVVTYGKSVAENLYRELLEVDPLTGFIGGGRHQYGDRTSVFTVGSVHLRQWDPDILIADEVHELGSGSRAEAIETYSPVKMIGLSASLEGRSDGSDIVVEGLFGGVIYRRSYADAELSGSVLPLRVDWLPMNFYQNPAAGLEGVHRQRAGLWRHQARNRSIADYVEALSSDTQTLLMVSTLEHACYLKRELPGFTLCFGGASVGTKANSKKSLASLAKVAGMSEKALMEAAANRSESQRAFASGELLKAISTQIWYAGVNFPKLAVVVRADGMASRIKDVQIPGRVCRADGTKDVGILVDCLDRFDPGFHAKALLRRRNYKSKGWKQVDVDPATFRKDT